MLGKNIFYGFVFAIFGLYSCNNFAQSNPKTTSKPEVDKSSSFTSFGEQISAGNALSPQKFLDIVEDLAVGDTLQLKFASEITSVCKAKGCWMTVDVETEKDIMVKFKDYAFFVPKDVENKKVVVNGEVFISEVSVEEQQHYAKDAGKSEAEIAAITSSEKTISFIADGVLIED